MQQLLKDLTRPMRRRVATSIYSFTSAEFAFRHADAQRYEFEHNATTIRENHEQLIAQWKAEKERGGLWHHAGSQWFEGDADLWGRYVDQVKTRRSLEIGSGPVGDLAPCYWIADRVIIDPLADKYRAEQLAINGETFFTRDIAVHTTAAEQLVPELVGTIDGSLICRNCLDHCEDPLAVLYNISEYAAPGCYLLLWSDIWHLAGLDAGHHNITRSEAMMDKIVEGLGFEILRRGSKIRVPTEYVEYGRLARKRP